MPTSKEVMDGLLINRREQHPEADPISDPIYLIKCAYVGLYGIVALGPMSMMFLLMQFILTRALGRDPYET